MSNMLMVNRGQGTYNIDTSLLPIEFRNRLIPGSGRLPLSVIEGGHILFQERSAGKHGRILHLIAKTDSDFRFSYKFSEPVVCLQFVKSNSYYCQLVDEETRPLRENAINIIANPGNDISISFLQGKFHEVFALLYPTAELFQFAELYSNFGKMLELIRVGRAGYLDSLDRYARPEFVNSITELAYKTYEKERFELYFQFKAKELLMMALDDFASPPPLIQKVLKKENDYQIVYQIKTMLEKDVANKPTLPALAKLIGWNKDKLSKGFREVYNMSVMEYFERIQMEHAEKLLLKTELSIHEISDKLNMYPSTFSKAFSSYFGIAPTRFRQTHMLTACR